ncbi:MAG: hypothetical protein R2713_03940 [Ilumatobacteraceae bacterium]
MRTSRYVPAVTPGSGSLPKNEKRCPSGAVIVASGNTPAGVVPSPLRRSSNGRTPLRPPCGHRRRSATHPTCCRQFDGGGRVGPRRAHDHLLVGHGRVVCGAVATGDGGGDALALSVVSVRVPGTRTAVVLAAAAVWSGRRGGSRRARHRGRDDGRGDGRYGGRVGRLGCGRCGGRVGRRRWTDRSGAAGGQDQRRRRRVRETDGGRSARLRAGDR